VLEIVYEIIQSQQFYDCNTVLTLNNTIFISQPDWDKELGDFFYKIRFNTL